MMPSEPATAPRKPNPRAISGKRRRLLGSVLSHVLLLAAAGLIAWFGYRYSLAWDWSTGNRNSVSETSQRLLAQLQHPLTITAYVRRDKLLRREVRELVARYQRFAPGVELLFVNREVDDLLTTDPSMGELRDAAISAGMLPMFKHGLLKVAAGVTTLSEVQRVCHREAS